VIYARWYDSGGSRIERKVGLGWLVAGGEPGGRPNGKTIGTWRERRGRPPEGYLTPDMARERLPSLIDQWRRGGGDRKKSEILFADAATAWMAERSAVAGWKPTTERNYRALLAGPNDPPKRRGRVPRARLMRRFGSTPVSSIDVRDVRAFLRGLDADPNLSARSVNAHRILLSMILGYCVEQGWSEENPVARVAKRREADPAELIVYTSEQVRAIARAAEDSNVAAIIRTAATTGLRMGELLELRWRDVDFARRSIHVQRSFSAGLGVTTPKGRRGRSVPLSDQAGSALATIGQRPRYTRSSDLCFPNALGMHLDPGTIRGRYADARDLVRSQDPDIPALTFHALRHCFGSHCAAAGIDVVTIQRWLGHASIKTTQRYMHHSPAVDDAARLSRAFAGSHAPGSAESVAA
jgi:integrase